MDHREKYRARHFALGLCIYCANPAVPGRLSCETCLAKDREANKVKNVRYYKQYADQGRCVRCSTPLNTDSDTGMKCCLNCREA